MKLFDFLNNQKMMQEKLNDFFENSSDEALLKFLSESEEFRNDFEKSLKKESKKEVDYLTMSKKQLLKLSDEDLYEAIEERIDEIVDECDENEDELGALSGKKKVFYVLNLFEMEINNGGLCQFFVNSSRVAAPFVSECMAEVGALEHKKLYDDFINKNGIDLNDLSSFDIDDVDEFEEQEKRYPFEEYDDAFYDMKPLVDFVCKYVRNNISDF